MNCIKKTILQSVALLFVLTLSFQLAQAQGATGIRGQVTDELGGTIVGATVTLVDSSGAQKTATTNEEGVYVFNGLVPGKYTVRVAQQGFALFENNEVTVTTGQRQTVDIKLSVTIEEQQVNVADERSLSTESDNNANAIVLKGRDLDVLPDDPDDLAAALTALAGPSAGPNGGQIYIDGFTGGRMPPKEAIREVRINQNPLNAENDQPGFGRIDILTRPGYGKISGSAGFQFNDEGLNSRNPFAPTRTDFQQRLFNFTLSGPISKQKASFFVDFQKRDVDDNDIINAVVLDPALNPVGFRAGVVQPRRFTTFSPRFDYAINQNHTLVVRYTFSRNRTENGGVGNYSLFERAINSSFTEQTFQITETAVLNPRWINETRFQFIHRNSEQEGDNTLPTVNVQGSFIAGGANVGLASVKERRWELQNYSTGTMGKHIIRFGARLRGVKYTDTSNSNFNGTFFFGGLTGVSTIEQYRQTVLNTPDFVPSQFILNSGNPEASVSQIDLGLFVQDEWRIRPNFNVTYGLRYENQSNISSNFNLAPRIFFAWAPGGANTGQIGQFGAGQPKFVIRGGVGVFYERLNESATLQATRFNGVNQLRFIVPGFITDAAGVRTVNPILDNVDFNADGTVDPATVPTAAALAPFAAVQSRTVIADNYQAPRSLLAAINVERQLPYNFTLWAVLFSYNTRHASLMRNINAPIPGVFDALGRPVRPNAGGDVYQYESSARFNDIRFQAGLRNQLSRNFSLFLNYQTGKAVSNTDCVFGSSGGCFPANTDPNEDFGRVAFFPRHRVFIGGVFTLERLRLTLSPQIVAATGTFFNIITGRDNNGDGIFNDRPAFVSATTKPEDIRVTPYGTFDVNPAVGTPIIPRNYGEGPGFFIVNLNMSRSIGFGDMPGASSAAPQGGSQRGGGGGGGGGAARGGLAGGGGAGAGAGARPAASAPVEKRYNLTFTANIVNIFNRTNLCPPVGNLASPLFGQSTSTTGPFGGCGFSGNNQSAGNRRVQLGVRLNF
ncbi:MAG TPA: TonB-dependent receptor [Pyrinomonadaceae bacterium]|nr:TonB-dependent receptor [Pyrinomonadaceae bacterium]